MDKKLEAAARAYHALPQPGKIEVRPTKSHNTQQDLTLAYSPGVAVPCKDIEADPELAYDYTSKGNLVAVHCCPIKVRKGTSRGLNRRIEAVELSDFAFQAPPSQIKRQLEAN